MIDKNNKYIETYKKVKNLKDKLEHCMDKDVIEIVTLLNCMDLHTTNSCQGHLTHGCISPWLHFSSEFYTGNNEDCITETCEIANKIERLFEKFYENRILSSYGSFLVVRPMGSGTDLSMWRMECLGQENTDSKKLVFSDKHPQKEKHILFQKEFQDFTEFLKEYYFSEEYKFNDTSK